MKMTKQHPIAPPPELVQQWEADWHYSGNTNGNGFTYFVATRAAQWGADQELEACCEWVQGLSWDFTPNDLRSARRPKPPSLKKQALKELAWVGKHLNMPLHNYCNAIHTIHQALEQLDD